MAKIVPNDKAPADLSIVSFAQGEYEIPFESDDPVVLANAAVHPWLSVEVDEADIIDPGVSTRPLLPADDRTQSLANDPDAVRAEIERRKDVAVSARVAIEAGLDQGDELYVGDHAVTLAAADEIEPVDAGPVEKDTSRKVVTPISEKPAPAVEKATTTTDKEKE